MSDRELREDLERLHAELDVARRESALNEEIAKLEERRDLARERIAAAARSLAEDEAELSRVRASTKDARRQIAALEPLGDPLAVSRSNWETQSAQGGCLQFVLFGALVWWFL